MVALYWNLETMEWRHYFSQPYDAITSENGEIFVADHGNHRIRVFDANSTFLRKFGSVPRRAIQVSTELGFDEGNLMVETNRRIMHLQKVVALQHPASPHFHSQLTQQTHWIIPSNRFEIYDENRWVKPSTKRRFMPSLPPYPTGQLWVGLRLDSLLIYRYLPDRSPTELKGNPLP